MASEKSDRSVRVELQEIVGHLRQLQSVLAVAVSALRQQNADLDADIANLLQRSVGDTLEEQVRKLDALLTRLPSAGARKREQR
jgi:hypothetical protein